MINPCFSGTTCQNLDTNLISCIVQMSFLTSVCVSRKYAGSCPGKWSIFPVGLSHPIPCPRTASHPFVLHLQTTFFLDRTVVGIMTPQKHVAEVPRTVLPRLTWNSASSRPTVPSHNAALAIRRRQQHPPGWGPLNWQTHSLNTHQSSRNLSTSLQSSAISSSISRQLSTSTSTLVPTEPLHNPIRHNGVYVAAFKPAQRAFHATPVRPRDHHFDTLKFVKRLQAEGFSEEQAVAMMRVLNDIIQESIQNLTRTMVLREGEYPSSLLSMIIPNRDTDRLGAIHIYTESRLRQTAL